MAAAIGTGEVRRDQRNLFCFYTATACISTPTPSSQHSQKGASGAAMSAAFAPSIGAAGFG